MFIRTLFLITALSVSAFSNTGLAQTSFGADRITAAQNKSQWIENLGQQLSNGIRNADSSLAINGARSGISSSLAIVVARDGSILDVRIVESTGNPSLDAALVRAALRVKRVQPFTPDMQGDSVIMVLDLGTKRG